MAAAQQHQRKGWGDDDGELGFDVEIEVMSDNEEMPSSALVAVSVNNAVSM